MLFSLVVISCTDEENPIQLLYVENNLLQAKYPASSESYSISIIGGDGNYTVTCDNNELLEINLTYGQTIVYKPLGVGETTVTVTDQSGNSYILNVEISHHTWSFEVTEKSARIFGDNLTIAQHRELEEKVLKTIPVAVGGGYQFIHKETTVYTNEDEQEVHHYRGDVHIYTEKYGGEYIEGSFEQKKLFLANGNSFPEFHITTADHAFQFELTPYSPSDNTKSSPLSPVALVEDLTETYIGDYPKLESAHSIQVTAPVDIRD